jgi:hypothetical protein
VGGPGLGCAERLLSQAPVLVPLLYLPPTGWCPEGTEQNRVRSKLKRLIAKRPPLQSLQERGLLRGEVTWASWGPVLCAYFTVFANTFAFLN